MGIKILIIATIGIILIFCLWYYFFKPKKKEPIVIEGYINYLLGSSIRHGEFDGLKKMSIGDMHLFRIGIFGEMSYLISDHPEKIINLIATNIEAEKKDYLNEMLAILLNHSIELSVEAALKVLQREKKHEDMMPVINHMASLINESSKKIFVMTLKERCQKSNFGTSNIMLKSDTERIEKLFRDLKI